MSLPTVRHVTTYRYSEPVDQSRLEITPNPADIMQATGWQKHTVRGLGRTPRGTEPGSDEIDHINTN